MDFFFAHVASGGKGRFAVAGVDGDKNGIFDGAPIAGNDDYLKGLGLDEFEDWHSLNR